jgi:hypothetical protein
VRDSAFAIGLVAWALVPGLIALGSATARAQDLDQDGLADAIERDGVADEPLLDFPAMGADPSRPDLFVQADWAGCDPILEYCGPNNSLDHHRMSSTAAFQLAAYFGPDVRVHVDSGVATRAGDVDRVHGAWGGARRQPFQGPYRCDPDVLGVRDGTFHRGVVTAINSGGGGDLFGACFGGDSVRMGVLAQELGHNFGIGHGGNFESFPANCKPHYRSPMNYAYTYDFGITRFSRGAFAQVVLNPTRMDELAGLGSTEPGLLASLRGSPWYLNVRDDGAIDWNRDGRYQTTAVRAAPTWAWAGCEQSTAHTDVMYLARDPAMAWLPEPGAPRFYVITRNTVTGVLERRFATRFDTCDPFIEPQSCTNFTPSPPDAAAIVPGAAGGTGFPATAGVLRAQAATLHVVYADETGRPVHQRLHMVGGAEVWEAPVRVSDVAFTGDPGLVELPGEDALLLLAPADGGLRSYRLDLASGAWSGGALVTWESGELVAPCAGVAVTRGFQADLGATEQVYAAIPTGERCALELARRDPASGAWQRFGSAAWVGAVPLVGGRPGLAYQPFDPATPEDGRFFVAWRPSPAGAGLIALSEGNDPRPAATTRRLKLEPGAQIKNGWALVDGGVTLGFDRRFDQNLRAIYVYANGGWVWFHPFADGIIDVDMRDQDDYAMIRKYLACSLVPGTCTP